jgi:hypothetical protein
MKAHYDDHPPPKGPGDPHSRAKWVFLGFLALATFFLLTEHRAHLLGFLPWLFLLACPLMHFFMHGGHGHHHGHGKHRGEAGHDRGGNASRPGGEEK